jgi:hypothetical protein
MVPREVFAASVHAEHIAKGSAPQGQSTSGWIPGISSLSADGHATAGSNRETLQVRGPAEGTLYDAQ